MKSSASIISLLLASALAASAQIISTPNIFNNGSSAPATVATNSGYDYNGFPLTSIDNLSASGQFFFGDYARFSNPPSNPSVNDQLMSLTGFSDPTGIASLRFFDGDAYEVGRVATQVTIYYSTSATTGNSLNPANYQVLNGGVAYQLPTNLNSNNGYLTGTDAASGIAYDTLTGLAIPAGTTSILFDFGPERDGYNGDSYFTGSGFTEIQAFGGVPEPSTYAMLFGGFGLLVFISGLRRKLAA